MSFTKWDYEFDGSHSDPFLLREAAGVYVVWCEVEGVWTVLDVGESDNVVNRIRNHDRADCWARNCSGKINYAAAYISDPIERRDLEYRIRSSERVVCGEE